MGLQWDFKPSKVTPNNNTISCWIIKRQQLKKKKQSQPSKSWGPPGGLAPLAPLPRLQLVFHKLHDPADQLKGGILAVQVLPDLIALLALGFLGCRMLQATPYSSGLLGFIILLV